MSWYTHIPYPNFTLSTMTFVPSLKCNWRVIFLGKELLFFLLQPRQSYHAHPTSGHSATWQESTQLRLKVRRKSMVNITDLSILTSLSPCQYLFHTAACWNTHSEIPSWSPCQAPMPDTWSGSHHTCALGTAELTHSAQHSFSSTSSGWPNSHTHLMDHKVNIQIGQTPVNGMQYRQCMHCPSRKLWENFTKFPSSCTAWSDAIESKLTTAELKYTVTSLGKNTSAWIDAKYVYSEGEECGAINLTLQSRQVYRHSSGTHDQSKSKPFLEKCYLKHIPSLTATNKNVLSSLFQLHRELAPQRHRVLIGLEQHMKHIKIPLPFHTLYRSFIPYRRYFFCN